MIYFPLIFLFISSTSFTQPLVDVKSELVNEINALRMKRFAKPLEYRVKFQKSCDAWSKHLSKTFHHAQGGFYEECIAISPLTEGIVTQFMNSPPHKAALMNRKARGICLSVYLRPAKIIEKENSVTYLFDTYYTVIRTYE